MDIALLFRDRQFFSDISMDGSDLQTGDDLESALIMSLFTDRRANTDDPLEKNEPLRGWWGDTFAEIKNDQIGSRLWLLRREKVLPIVLLRAQAYAQEATQWLVDDMVAESVVIETEVIGERQNGILGIKVTVKRPTGISDFKFNYAWDEI
jgi:phage gp46-like protein